MPETRETYPPTVWSDAVPPGGRVCAVPTPGPDGICGYPVESEPCPEHPAVPAELVATLGQQLYDDWHEGCEENGCNGASLNEAEEVAAEYLAAVLPAHEAMVRAKVAEEIEQRRPSSTTPGPRHKHYWMGMTRAAHIARGEHP